MVNQLIEEEIEQFSNLNKTADQIIFNLGLAEYEKYKLLKEFAKIEQTNDQLTQELLAKYGEGELNLQEKTFTTKE